MFEAVLEDVVISGKYLEWIFLLLLFWELALNWLLLDLGDEEQIEYSIQKNHRYRGTCEKKTLIW